MDSKLTWLQNKWQRVCYLYLQSIDKIKALATCHSSKDENIPRSRNFHIVLPYPIIIHNILEQVTNSYNISIIYKNIQENHGQE